MRWRIQRIASQLEHPVVHAQAQRADERHLYTAAGVEREARVLVRAQRLAVEPAAGREIRLESVNRERRLQQHVAAAGAKRRRFRLWIVGRERVLAFESD